MHVSSCPWIEALSRVPQAKIKSWITTTKTEVHCLATFWNPWHIRLFYSRVDLKINNISSSCRNILGEELEQLDINELEEIEHQLDSSLKTIRSNKVCKNNSSVFVKVKVILLNERSDKSILIQKTRYLWIKIVLRKYK